MAKVAQGRIHRFSQSDVSSAFSGSSTILDKTYLIDSNATVNVGDAVIFPDNKSLVLYLGEVESIDNGTYTIKNIIYLRDTWQFMGDYITGVPASYPEVYRYNGGSWLCLVSDTNNAPTEGSEWKLLTAKLPDIPNPTFYKVEGDALQDLGIGQVYLIANTNLKPSGVTPKIGDIAIFYTTEATYLGLVMLTNGNGALVEAKVKLGTILPEPTPEDEGKVLGISGGKLAYVDKAPIVE